MHIQNFWEPDGNPSFCDVAELSNPRQLTKGKAVVRKTSEEFQVEKEMLWEEVPTYLNLFYPTITSVLNK